MLFSNPCPYRRLDFFGAKNGCGNSFLEWSQFFILYRDNQNNRIETDRFSTPDPAGVAH